AAIPDGPNKLAGQRIGWVAADQVIRTRTGDGLVTPIGSTATFPTLTPGPGVWRLTPSAYAAPQTPWAAKVQPFVLKDAAQFLPGPPPSLSSSDWATAFNELKTYGSATSTARTADETAIAKFWSANVVRQYNRIARDVIDARGLDLAQSARLAAMVNVVAADAGISVMYAKYHYLFWRPVTAIDPTSVSADGFGPTPGFDDGNAATVEQPGWRPLLVTPNHPEYPAAHGAVTGAMADVLGSVLGNVFNLDIHGFDANGAAGNLDAVQHFNTADDLRTQIVNARVWAGLHYRFSGLAGVALGTNVADYDLKHAFQPDK
ncbi:MAG TPA: vanadium-dependent haloperoxidase, partial [Mycobacteriales bacterium]|nr:vanadium-dependent haloperoxidase [Mycobacteriales bacterium]